MKKVVIGAMAVLALTACSNEEVIQTNEQNQEISFSAVTGKSLSRAADGYCNNKTPNEFKVAAAYTTDGSTYAQYFINDGYIKSVLDTDPNYANHKNYVATGSVRYWPELGTADDNQKLKFFAYLNADAGTPENPNPNWVTTGADAYQAMTAKFTVKNDVDKQVDFIYAVKEAQEKPSEGQLAINFCHALSQIEFRAKNANNKIHVIVDGVKVVNVKNTGTFTMKDATTNNFVGHTTGEDLGTAETDSRVGRGKWSDQSGTASYEITTASKVALNGTAKDLTAETGNEFTTRSMYLLPQTLTPWSSGIASSSTDSYFLLKALIYNIADAGGTVNTNTDVVLWGGKDASDKWITKYIAIPVPADTKWEDGKRYVYTFVFTTNGNGGSDPTTGDPVLTPIKLEITVDDFVDVENKDVELNK